MQETHARIPETLSDRELEKVIEKLSEQIVTVAFAIEVKVIRENTLQGVNELFAQLSTLQQQIEELAASYPRAKKELINVWVMISLLTTGVQIGDKRRGLLEVELAETKRAR